MLRDLLTGSHSYSIKKWGGLIVVLMSDHGQMDSMGLQSRVSLIRKAIISVIVLCGLCTHILPRSSLVPRPRPAFRRLQYSLQYGDGKLGGAWERG